MGWRKDQSALFKSLLEPLGHDLSLVVGYLALRLFIVYD